MNNVEIQVKGLDKLFEKLGRATAIKTLEEPMYQGALNMQAWAQKNRLSGPRPNILGVVTGRLRSSISVSRSIRKDEITFFIGTNVQYARIHEFGGRTGKNHRVVIPPRPFLRPAVENNQNRKLLVNLVTSKINEALKK